MSNKTIDGVSLELLKNIEMTWRQASGFSSKANDLIAEGLGELRTLLNKSQVEPATQRQAKAVAAKVAAYTPGMGLVELRVSGGLPPWLELGESVTVIAGEVQHPAEPITVLNPFAEKVISKLRRFEECASDNQAADIGRHWFDLLTQLGLLNRVQRSPALWEMTQQGEEALEVARLNTPQ